MIHLQKNVPDIYYTHSRDFQFIGRLFDVILNSIKTNSEQVSHLPISELLNNRLLDLLSLTIGFKSRHKYNLKQLQALCSVFFSALKAKGTLSSLDAAAQTIVTADGETTMCEVAILNAEKPWEITIFIPSTLSDTNLLKDILYYILPAGCSCSIVKELRESVHSTSNIYFKDEPAIYGRGNVNWVEDKGQPWGEDKQTTDQYLSIVPKVNVEGLLDNTAKATPGLLVNSTVVRTIPLEDSDNTDINSSNTIDNNN